MPVQVVHATADGQAGGDTITTAQRSERASSTAGPIPPSRSASHITNLYRSLHERPSAEAESAARLQCFVNHLALGQPRMAAAIAPRVATPGSGEEKNADTNDAVGNKSSLSDGGASSLGAAADGDAPPPFAEPYRSMLQQLVDGQGATDFATSPGCGTAPTSRSRTTTASDPAPMHLLADDFEPLLNTWVPTHDALRRHAAAILRDPSDAAPASDDDASAGKDSTPAARLDALVHECALAVSFAAADAAHDRLQLTDDELASFTDPKVASALFRAATSGKAGPDDDSNEQLATTAASFAERQGSSLLSIGAGPSNGSGRQRVSAPSRFATVGASGFCTVYGEAIRRLGFLLDATHHDDDHVVGGQDADNQRGHAAPPPVVVSFARFVKYFDWASTVAGVASGVNGTDSDDAVRVLAGGAGDTAAVLASIERWVLPLRQLWAEAHAIFRITVALTGTPNASRQTSPNMALYVPAAAAPALLSSSLTTALQSVAFARAFLSPHHERIIAVVSTTAATSSPFTAEQFKDLAGRCGHGVARACAADPASRAPKRLGLALAHLAERRCWPVVSSVLWHAHTQLASTLAHPVPHEAGDDRNDDDADDPSSAGRCPALAELPHLFVSGDEDRAWRAAAAVANSIARTSTAGADGGTNNTADELPRVLVAAVVHMLCDAAEEHGSARRFRRVQRGGRDATTSASSKEERGPDGVTGGSSSQLDASIDAAGRFLSLPAFKPLRTAVAAACYLMADGEPQGNDDDDDDDEDRNRGDKEPAKREADTTATLTHRFLAATSTSWRFRHHARFIRGLVTSDGWGIEDDNDEVTNTNATPSSPAARDDDVVDAATVPIAAARRDDDDDDNDDGGGVAADAPDDVALDDPMGSGGSSSALSAFSVRSDMAVADVTVTPVRAKATKDDGAQAKEGADDPTTTLSPKASPSSGADAGHDEDWLRLDRDYLPPRMKKHSTPADVFVQQHLLSALWLFRQVVLAPPTATPADGDDVSPGHSPAANRRRDRPSGGDARVGSMTASFFDMPTPSTNGEAAATRNHVDTDDDDGEEEEEHPAELLLTLIECGCNLLGFASFANVARLEIALRSLSDSTLLATADAANDGTAVGSRFRDACVLPQLAALQTLTALRAQVAAAGLGLSRHGAVVAAATAASKRSTQTFSDALSKLTRTISQLSSEAAASLLGDQGGIACTVASQALHLLVQGVLRIRLVSTAADDANKNNTNNRSPASLAATVMAAVTSLRERFAPFLRRSHDGDHVKCDVGDVVEAIVTRLGLVQRFTDVAAGQGYATDVDAARRSSHGGASYWGSLFEHGRVGAGAGGTDETAPTGAAHRLVVRHFLTKPASWLLLRAAELRSAELAAHVVDSLFIVGAASSVSAAAAEGNNIDAASREDNGARRLLASEVERHDVESALAELNAELCWSSEPKSGDDETAASESHDDGQHQPRKSTVLGPDALFHVDLSSNLDRIVAAECGGIIDQELHPAAAALLSASFSGGAEALDDGSKFLSRLAAAQPVATVEALLKDLGSTDAQSVRHAKGAAAAHWRLLAWRVREALTTTPLDLDELSRLVGPVERAFDALHRPRSGGEDDKPVRGRPRSKSKTSGGGVSQSENVLARLLISVHRTAATIHALQSLRRGRASEAAAASPPPLESGKDLAAAGIGRIRSLLSQHAVLDWSWLTSSAVRRHQPTGYDGGSSSGASTPAAGSSRPGTPTSAVAAATTASYVGTHTALELFSQLLATVVGTDTSLSDSDTVDDHDQMVTLRNLHSLMQKAAMEFVVESVESDSAVNVAQGTLLCAAAAYAPSPPQSTHHHELMPDVEALVGLWVDLLPAEVQPLVTRRVDEWAARRRALDATFAAVTVQRLPSQALRESIRTAMLHADTVALEAGAARGSALGLLTSDRVACMHVAGPLVLGLCGDGFPLLDFAFRAATAHQQPQQQQQQRQADDVTSESAAGVHTSQTPHRSPSSTAVDVALPDVATAIASWGAQLTSLYRPPDVVAVRAAGFLLLNAVAPSSLQPDDDESRRGRWVQTAVQLLAGVHQASALACILLAGTNSNSTTTTDDGHNTGAGGGGAAATAGALPLGAGKSSDEHAFFVAARLAFVGACPYAQQRRLLCDLRAALDDDDAGQASSRVGLLMASHAPIIAAELARVADAEALLSAASAAGMPLPSPIPFVSWTADDVRALHIALIDRRQFGPAFRLVELVEQNCAPHMVAAMRAADITVTTHLARAARDYRQMRADGVARARAELSVLKAVGETAKSEFGPGRPKLRPAEVRRTITWRLITAISKNKDDLLPPEAAAPIAARVIHFALESPMLKRAFAEDPQWRRLHLGASVVDSLTGAHILPESRRKALIDAFPLAQYADRPFVAIESLLRCGRLDDVAEVLKRVPQLQFDDVLVAYAAKALDVDRVVDVAALIADCCAMAPDGVAHGGGAADAEEEEEEGDEEPSIAEALRALRLYAETGGGEGGAGRGIVSASLLVTQEPAMLDPAVVAAADLPRIRDRFEYADATLPDPAFAIACYRMCRDAVFAAESVAGVARRLFDSFVAMHDVSFVVPLLADIGERVCAAVLECAIEARDGTPAESVFTVAPKPAKKVSLSNRSAASTRAATAAAAAGPTLAVPTEAAGHGGTPRSRINSGSPHHSHHALQQQQQQQQQHQRLSEEPITDRLLRLRRLFAVAAKLPLCGEGLHVTVADLESPAGLRDVIAELRRRADSGVAPVGRSIAVDIAAACLSLGAPEATAVQLDHIESLLDVGHNADAYSAIRALDPAVRRAALPRFVALLEHRPVVAATYFCDFAPQHGGGAGGAAATSAANNSSSNNKTKVAVPAAASPVPVPLFCSGTLRTLTVAEIPDVVTARRVLISRLLDEFGTPEQLCAFSLRADDVPHAVRSALQRHLSAEAFYTHVVEPVRRIGNDATRRLRSTLLQRDASLVSLRHLIEHACGELAAQGGLREVFAWASWSKDHGLAAASALTIACGGELENRRLTGSSRANGGTNGTGGTAAGGGGGGTAVEVFNGFSASRLSASTGIASGGGIEGGTHYSPSMGSVEFQRRLADRLLPEAETRLAWLNKAMEQLDAALAASNALMYDDGLSAATAAQVAEALGGPQQQQQQQQQQQPTNEGGGSFTSASGVAAVATELDHLSLRNVHTAVRCERELLREATQVLKMPEVAMAKLSLFDPMPPTRPGLLGPAMLSAFLVHPPAPSASFAIEQLMQMGSQVAISRALAITRDLDLAVSSVCHRAVRAASDAKNVKVIRAVVEELERALLTAEEKNAVFSEVVQRYVTVHNMVPEAERLVASAFGTEACRHHIAALVYIARPQDAFREALRFPSAGSTAQLSALEELLSLCRRVGSGRIVLPRADKEVFRAVVAQIEHRVAPLRAAAQQT